MTELQLISELSSKYKKVENPVESSSSPLFDNIRLYDINVFEIGKSPEEEPLSGDRSLCYTIEPTLSSAMLSDATSGQTNIIVNSTSGFAQDQVVTVMDNNNKEDATISSITDSTLVMNANLTYAYQTSNEGKVELQDARYWVQEPINTKDKSLVVTGGQLSLINRIYSDADMRKRVQGSLGKAARNIINEALPSSAITADATSGQKNVTVASGTTFWEGKIVVVSDDLSSEDATVASIAGNTLTMEDNLTNSYTTVNNGEVTFKDNSERVSWASDCLKNVDNHLDVFMWFIALNATVQSNGGAASDSDIDWIVSSEIKPGYDIFESTI